MRVLALEVLERVEVPGGRVARLGARDVEADDALVAVGGGQLGDLAAAGLVPHRGQQLAYDDRAGRRGAPPPGPRRSRRGPPRRPAPGTARPRGAARGRSGPRRTPRRPRRGRARTRGPPGAAAPRSASPRRCARRSRGSAPGSRSRRTPRTSGAARPRRRRAARARSRRPARRSSAAADRRRGGRAAAPWGRGRPARGRPDVAIDIGHATHPGQPTGGHAVVSSCARHTRRPRLDVCRTDPDRLDWGAVDAVLFDLDGVITPTAEVHMHAWAEMFAPFLDEPAGRAVHRRRTTSRTSTASRATRASPRCSPPATSSCPGATPPTRPRRRPSAGSATARTCCSARCSPATASRRTRARSSCSTCSTSEAPGWRSCPARRTRRTCCGRPVSSSASRRSWTAPSPRSRELPGKPRPDTYEYAADVLGVPHERAVVVEDALSGVAGRGRRRASPASSASTAAPACRRCSTTAPTSWWRTSPSSCPGRGGRHDAPALRTPRRASRTPSTGTRSPSTRGG